MSPDPLDLLWRMADAAELLLTTDEIAEVPPSVLGSLKKLGLFRQDRAATHVVCDACAEGHVEEVIRVAGPVDSVRFYIVCPENGRVEVAPGRLLQWSVDYGPVLPAVVSALAVREAPEEVIGGRLWHLGRAPLAGRSRPVWVARGLAWPDARILSEALPRGRSPILFYLGQAPEAGTVHLPTESIFALKSLVTLEGDKLIMDRDTAETQLLASDAARPATKKKPIKRASRAGAIDAIKAALREHLRGAKKYAYEMKERHGGPELLPRPTQKQLAKLLKLSESAVSRALRDPSDKELRILWDGALRLDYVMRFKG